MRIFLAGAAGVIGRRLCPLLLADGHHVAGTTRSPERAEALRVDGIEPVVVDIFDAGATRDAVVKACPDVVIHQLTDLPSVIDAANLPAVLARNARIRDEGTRNLLAGARGANVKRVIAQSIAFAYAPGEKPLREDAPLNTRDDGNAGVTARGVESLEQQVLQGPWIGILLRYGRLYGPGAASTPTAPALHVDAAAEVARRAVNRGNAGIYNVADNDGVLDSARARAAFGRDATSARV